tara:strand:+ start:14019 stop:15542 length:1524 start_codon:yes stop_codon:yes gene_type:complete
LEQPHIILNKLGYFKMDDLVKYGLLGAGDKKNAALMALFNLGAQIGNRSAPRLTPTPPALDMSKVMGVYQNTLTNAMKRRALVKELEDREKRRSFFDAKAIDPVAASQIAMRGGLQQAQLESLLPEGAVNVETAKYGEELFPEDFAQYDAQRAMETAPNYLKAAEAQTTIPSHLSFLDPAKARALMGLGKIDDKLGMKTYADLLTAKPSESLSFEQKKELARLKGGIRKDPTSVREFRFAKKNGFPGNFAEWVRYKQPSLQPLTQKRADQNLNIEMANAGFTIKRDSRGNITKVVPIEGGKVDVQKKEKEIQRLKTASQKGNTSRVALQSIAGIEKIMRESKLPDYFLTGTASRAISWVSETDAGKLLSHVASLKSQVVLGTMMKLKEASKQGATGFGQLNQKELQILIDSIGALDPKNTNLQIFKGTLNRVKHKFIHVLMGVKKYLTTEKIKELGFRDLINKLPEDQAIEAGREALRRNPTKLKEIMKRFSDVGQFITPEMLGAPQ